MSQQLQITGGAKVRDLNDVIIGTSGVLSSLAFNVANGVPKLDSNGKILVSQLPNSVMEYQGTWNASTNTPTLVNGVGNQGDVYLCNVAGTTNFGAGPITFAVGDSAIYSGTIWQRAGGATGTVTSVGLSTSGNAFTIGSSPVTTSGTITINGSGTSGQYINGAGNLTTFPTLISSIGLSMPSAFNVSNSPLTANGTIAVTGAGYPSQYIRGDGTLADFPSSGGGGSSVSYYLNGGTSQGTIGGITYYEMSKTADTGTGVDFPKSGDGLIVSFLTDAGDPAQLNIPAGNWNYEIYASMSANGGTPQMYAELYKYDGTIFTLIATSSNEILYDGVNLNLYTFAMTVPATTLALTDRLAVKLYATNSGGKTTTVHTQDSHLCQVITTFSTGITALNGLTAQVQYFATGTSGTDFNISSTTATHTFNIPDASATARGLITTGSQTIAGSKTFSSFDTLFSQGFFSDYAIKIKKDGSISIVSGYVSIGEISGTGTSKIVFGDGYSSFSNSLLFNTTSDKIYTFPNASGTIALTSNLSSYVPYTGATASVNLGAFGITASSLLVSNNSTFNSNLLIKKVGLAVTTPTYVTQFAASSGVGIGYSDGTGGANFILQTASIYDYTFPAATGTLALTSDLSGYVTLTTTQTISGVKTFSNILIAEKAVILGTGTTTYVAGQTSLNGNANGLTIGLGVTVGGTTTNYAHQLLFPQLIPYSYTFPAATGTVALTSDLGSYVPTTRTISTTAPLQGGGDLSANRTLSITQATTSTNGYLSSTDWNTFNGKQNALTNPVTGTGTTNYLSKFTGTSTLGNSLIWDNGTNVGIGNTNTSYTLDVSGTGRFTGNLITTNSLIFNSGTLFSAGNVGLSYRSSDTTLYLQMPATGFNITDNALNTKFILSSTGAATFSSSVTVAGPATFSSYLSAEGDISTRSGNYLAAYRSDNTRYLGLFTDNNGCYVSSYIPTSEPLNIQSNGTSGRVVINTAGIERMRISSGGIVTITGNSGSLVQQAGTVGGDVYHEFKNSAGTRRAYLGFGGASSSVFDIWNSENGDMKFATNNTEKWRITSTGRMYNSNVTANNYALEVNGSTTASQSYGIIIYAGSNSSDDGLRVLNYTGGTQYFKVRGDGQINVGAYTYANAVGTPRTVYIDSAGTIGGISSILASKTNIKQFDTNWLYELNPIQFNYRKKDENEEYTDEFDSELYYGLIAEETELVNKEICTYNNDKLIGIEYSKLVPVLVKAIQEQNQLITSLQDRLDKAGL